MAISVADITNSGNTGIFDELMSAAAAHIDSQYTSGKIKGTDYANVYLGTIQNVLAQSIQFAIQSKTADAEIAVKVAQEAEILDGTTRANTKLADDLITSSKQQILLDTEEEIKTAQLAEIIDSTLRANTKLSDDLVTSGKQQTLLDTEEEIKQYEHDVLQVDKHNINLEQVIKTQEEIDLLQTQDKLAYTERVKADKECAKLGLDDVVKTQNSTGELVYTPKYEEAV